MLGTPPAAGRESVEVLVGAVWCGGAVSHMKWRWEERGDSGRRDCGDCGDCGGKCWIWALVGGVDGCEDVRCGRGTGIGSIVSTILMGGWENLGDVFRVALSLECLDVLTGGRPYW